MLRELIARLGVQVDDKPVQGLMSTLDQVKGKLGGLVTGLATGAVAMFIKGQIDAADALGDTADRIGVSTDELQRFQYALQLTGADAEGAEKALFILNKTLGEAAGGGAPAAEFEKLGIKIKDANGNIRKGTDLLPDIADAVAKAGSEAERTAIATKFFSKAGLSMLPMLKRGREGVKELSDEFDDLGGGISSDVIQAAGEVNDGLDRLKFTTKALATNALAALMPYLITAMHWFTKVSATIGHLVKNTTLGKTAFMALSVIGVAKLLPMIWQGVRAFSALRTVVFGASFPFLLVVAAIAALYLVFDDLYGLMTGSESLIGNVLDKFGQAGDKAKLVKTLQDAWTQVKTAIAAVKPILSDLWKKIAEGSSTWVPALATAFAAVVKGIVAGITALSGLVSAISKAASKDWKGALAEIDKAGDSIFGKKQSYWDPATGQMVSKSVGGLFGEDQAKWDAASNAGTPGSVTVNSQATTKVEVHVPAGTAPEAVGPMVTNGVAKGVKQSHADAYHAVANTAG